MFANLETTVRVRTCITCKRPIWKKSKCLAVSSMHQRVPHISMPNKGSICHTCLSFFADATKETRSIIDLSGKEEQSAITEA